MKDRAKQIRKDAGLTQQQFADRLGVSKSTIESIEYGRREISERTFRDICRIFHVSENWLKTGEGEMYLAPTREDEIAEMTARMFKAEDSDYRFQLERILNTVDDEQMEALFNIANNWVEEVKKAREAAASAGEK